MTHLRQAMLEELQRRNYATTTVQYYIQAVERFAKYFRTPPDQLNQSHVRTYQAYLLRERKLGPRTVKLHVSAMGAPMRIVERLTARQLFLHALLASVTHDTS